MLDVIEIDGASNNGVDNVRDLIEKARFEPTQGAFKIYIIDEVHMLSDGAFNALLKIVEEPPKHVKFILATTEIDKVPDTIQSRSLRFDFEKIHKEDIVARLVYVTNEENIKASTEALERRKEFLHESTDPRFRRGIRGGIVPLSRRRDAEGDREDV